MHHQWWGLCSATVGPGQSKPHREPQIWKELVESKTQGTSWGIAPTLNEAAPVEEPGCDESGDKRDPKLSTDHA
jgi:hypothetical protein